MKLKITQIKSANRRPEDQQVTLTALGLKMNKCAVHEDTSSIRGMIFKVKHLIKVEEVNNN
ncbi:50S ribosomal protein L30 [Rickettsiales endosymbiont of Stachyamoeba lipophora]|uniref:50S ribosomal protein L30 n=1 Tax=Rickettsiales endosymbiont of Stachyamoeba lipophora TaxID=2486578 RepID=UPI000F646E47|nr:50S ribosomal protein L30 [Rickettsiales endosymbiont of Stachyamoeba lipophora]AZL15882.1 50S ribosomal protein L30 [Rickettsiales endosymbiont of Stachyamoeba lipophora]